MPLLCFLIKIKAMKLFNSQNKNSSAKKNQSKKTVAFFTTGFVSLFAVLMSLVILAITIGISNVAFKENVLAHSAREGSYAFFAADTGLECALYYDSLSSFYDPVTGFLLFPDIDCAENSINTSMGSNQSVNFNFNIEMAGKERCVEVSVDKDEQIEYPANSGTLISATKIYSNGFNINCADVTNASSNRVVNRLLIATYPNPIPPPPVVP